MHPAIDWTFADDPSDWLAQLIPEWLGARAAAVLICRPVPSMADPSCLSSEEQDRLSQMSAPHRRQSFVAGRWLIRQSLARVVGTSPGEVELRIGPNGAISAPSPAPWFSLSHGKGAIGLALSAHGPLGLDIEIRRPVPEAAAIARDWPKGDQVVIAQDRPEEPAEFLRLWTAREAVLKCFGRGLADLARLNAVPLADAAQAETPFGRVALFDGSQPSNDPLYATLALALPNPMVP